MKAEFLLGYGVCLQLHCTKSGVNWAKSAQSAWIYTQTPPSRTEPSARLTPPVAPTHVLCLCSTGALFSKPPPRLEVPQLGKEMCGQQKALPTFRCWKPPNETGQSVRWEWMLARTPIFFSPPVHVIDQARTLFKSNKKFLLYNKNSMF